MGDWVNEVWLRKAEWEWFRWHVKHLSNHSKRTTDCYDFSGTLRNPLCHVLAPFLSATPGRELDKRKVPKCHLARHDGKGGKANILPRRRVWVGSVGSVWVESLSYSILFDWFLKGLVWGSGPPNWQERTTQASEVPLQRKVLGWPHRTIDWDTGWPGLLFAHRHATLLKT